MEKELSCNVSIHEEDMNGKNVFVVECSELGVSDFGYNLDEALHNLREGIKLFLAETPEKKELLQSPKPLMITRLFL